MFWLARLMRFWRPMPPTPTPAMFSRSLGGVKPRPSTWRGTNAAAALPAAAVLRNLRRVSPFSSLPPFAWFLLCLFSSFISSLIISPVSLSAETLSLDSRSLATAQFCLGLRPRGHRPIAEFCARERSGCWVEESAERPRMMDVVGGADPADRGWWKRRHPTKHAPRHDPTRAKRAEA
jgi:hypothetical protein